MFPQLETYVVLCLWSLTYHSVWCKRSACESKSAVNIDNARGRRVHLSFYGLWDGWGRSRWDRSSRLPFSLYRIRNWLAIANMLIGLLQSKVSPWMAFSFWQSNAAFFSRIMQESSESMTVSYATYHLARASNMKYLWFEFLKLPKNRTLPKMKVT
jgi:hypothetical protein